MLSVAGSLPSSQTRNSLKPDISLPPPIPLSLPNSNFALKFPVILRLFLIVDSISSHQTLIRQSVGVRAKHIHINNTRETQEMHQNCGKHYDQLTHSTRMCVRFGRLVARIAGASEPFDFCCFYRKGDFCWVFFYIRTMSDALVR